jgi:hypothetical protein
MTLPRIAVPSTRFQQLALSAVLGDATLFNSHGAACVPDGCEQASNHDDRSAL